MSVAVRAVDLRKIYDAPPPAAAGGRTGLGPLRRRRSETRARTGVTALDGLSLDIRPGEIFGLLGPNGAGKSTTIGILTTRVRPTAGTAFVGSHDVWRDGVAVKRLIGVVQQRPNLDFGLTAREMLTFHGAYFGVSSADRQRRADALLSRFQLADRADELVFGFSGGMLQRLSIARALMHEPQVLFLDEPTAGLDPQTRLLLWDIVRELNAAGRTIVLTTHNMEEADQMCHRLAIVDHGRVIAEGTAEALKRAVPGGYLIRAQLGGDPEPLRAGLAGLAGVTEIKITGTTCDVYADRGGALIAPFVQLAQTHQLEVVDVHISAPSLENLFLHHTGRSLRD
ncbi:MAG: ABC transporter ATP-binding protein [Vicinamibacterales bacterium]